MWQKRPSFVIQVSMCTLTWSHAYNDFWLLTCHHDANFIVLSSLQVKPECLPLFCYEIMVFTEWHLIQHCLALRSMVELFPSCGYYSYSALHAHALIIFKDLLNAHCLEGVRVGLRRPNPVP